MDYETLAYVLIQGKDTKAVFQICSSESILPHLRVKAIINFFKQSLLHNQLATAMQLWYKYDLVLVSPSAIEEVSKACTNAFVRSPS